MINLLACDEEGDIDVCSGTSNEAWYVLEDQFALYGATARYVLKGMVIFGLAVRLDELGLIVRQSA